MKKVLSVWMLIVRSSIYKVLLILGILVGFQMGAFALLTFMMPDQQYYGWTIKVSIPMFLCAVLAMLEVLTRVLTSRKGKMVYTLQRLSISEKEIFLLQASVNWMMFVLLLLVQAAVLLGITAVYTYLQTGVNTGMSVLVTAQWNPLLRVLLPYGDWLATLWIVLMPLALGVVAAALAFQFRNDHREVVGSAGFWGES